MVLQEMKRKLSYELSPVSPRSTTFSQWPVRPKRSSDNSFDGITSQTITSYTVSPDGSPPNCLPLDCIYIVQSHSQQPSLPLFRTTGSCYNIPIEEFRHRSALLTIFHFESSLV